MSNIECKISTDKSSQRKEQNNDFKYNKKRPTNTLQPRKRELSIAIKSVLVLIDIEKYTLRFFFILLEKQLNVRLTKGTWKKVEKKLEKLLWLKHKKDIEFPSNFHKHLRDKEKDIVSKKISDDKSDNIVYPQPLHIKEDQNDMNDKEKNTEKKNKADIQIDDAVIKSDNDDAVIACREFIDNAEIHTQNYLNEWNLNMFNDKWWYLISNNILMDSYKKNMREGISEPVKAIFRTKKINGNNNWWNTIHSKRKITYHLGFQLEYDKRNTKDIAKMLHERYGKPK